MPLAFVVSRVCEEFPSLTPLTAIELLDTAPVGWVWEVIEARHYGHAKAAIEAWDAAAVPRKQRGRGPMLSLVETIEAELVRERLTNG